MGVMPLTSCVGELVLLALYAVLQGLGIATRDLDALLDALSTHLGHYDGRSTMQCVLQDVTAAVGAQRAEV